MKKKNADTHITTTGIPRLVLRRCARRLRFRELTRQGGRLVISKEIPSHQPHRVFGLGSARAAWHPRASSAAPLADLYYILYPGWGASKMMRYVDRGVPDLDPGIAVLGIAN